MSAPPDPFWHVGKADAIPRRGARVVATFRGPVAIFRTSDDHFFALDDRCPHRGGPLSEGLVHDRRVTCPLHATEICLESGACEEGGGSVARHVIRIVEGRIYLALSSGLRQGPEENGPVS